jgi:hypothetical protein
METIIANLNTTKNITINNLNSNISKLISNPILYSLLALFLTIYGPRLQPKLPPIMRNLFNNNYFRFLIILLVTYMTSKNLQLALIISIGFCLIISLATSQEIQEKFIEQYSENKSNIISENFTTKLELPSNKLDQSKSNSKIPLECINGVNNEQCIDYCLSNNDAYCKQNFPSKNVVLDCSNPNYNLQHKIACLNASCDNTSDNNIEYCKLSGEQES